MEIIQRFREHQETHYNAEEFADRLYELGLGRAEVLDNGEYKRNAKIVHHRKGDCQGGYLDVFSRVLNCRDDFSGHEAQHQRVKQRKHVREQNYNGPGDFELLWYIKTTLIYET